MRIAGLFSGQGSQYSGMGKELCENFEEARRVYECAGDLLGYDVKKLSFEGAEEELQLTLYAQPLIFTHSVAAFAVARKTLPMPHGVAGHSMGEFAALQCGGGYSLEDGFRLIGARAKAMDVASKTVPASMYAVIGGESSEAEAVCESVDGLVIAANYNLPTQTVIAGESAATAKAAEILAEQGKKVVQLNVSTAFHTSLMEGACDIFLENIGGVAFQPLQTDFYSNVTGARYKIEDYAAYFVKHMVSPVRFVEECQAMEQDGVTVCVEFGPKKTVSTLAKKNVRAFTVCNVDDLASLKKAEKTFASL